MSNLEQIFAEGHRAEAWHGANLTHALAGVPEDMALWRPSPTRHNLAEIALHHAYYVHSVRGRIAGVPLEPFATDEGDWTVVPGQLNWGAVQAVLEEQNQRLETLVAGVAAGREASPLTPAEVQALVLGITCHSAYHAGQVNLLKVLRNA